MCVCVLFVVHYELCTYTLFCFSLVITEYTINKCGWLLTEGSSASQYTLYEARDWASSCYYNMCGECGIYCKLKVQLLLYLHIQCSECIILTKTLRFKVYTLIWNAAWIIYILYCFTYHNIQLKLKVAVLI